MGTPGLFSTQFLSTGAQQDWTVPGGVRQVYVVMAGANDPLLGQAIECLLTVTPGEVLHLFVGGAPDVAGFGGWNGGGNGAMAPDSFVSSAGYGATDIRRGGITLADRILVAGGGTGIGWEVTESGLAYGVGDFGEIDPLYGYSIRSTMPGPSEAPRVVRLPNPVDSPPTTYTLLTAGNPGGDTVGADAVSGDGFSLGAGGGGAGGGASGARYTMHVPDDPDLDGRVVTAGGNTGGWYAAPGLAATPGARLRDYVEAPEAYAGGGIRFEWFLSNGGWNVGHLGG